MVEHDPGGVTPAQSGGTSVPGGATADRAGVPTPSAAATHGPSAHGPRLSRRRFVAWVGSFSIVSTLAMVATPVLAFLVPPRTTGGAAGGRVPAGTVDDLPLGSGTVVAMGSTPAIVLNTEQGVRAFNAICPHLGCIVAWDASNGTIVCPCHDGRFSAANGSVLSGPPPGPLAAVTVAVEEGRIFLVPG